MVLMADDDEDDGLLAREALEASGANALFSRVKDGADLMDYLLERAGSIADDLPKLILPDLNMPKKDGREALLEIKANPETNRRIE